ncbi:hypothetical protein R1flu_006855 [Riccia fluitans]|uniref:Uncharacterized protein n=1 Tax=Riccia fluitans TaxID=41844 RepID=A0ABD1YXT0_9MARC
MVVDRTTRNTAMKKKSAGTVGETEKNHRRMNSACCGLLWRDLVLFRRAMSPVGRGRVVLGDRPSHGVLMAVLDFAWLPCVLPAGQVAGTPGSPNTPPASGFARKTLLGSRFELPITTIRLDDEDCVTLRVSPRDEDGGNSCHLLASNNPLEGKGRFGSRTVRKRRLRASGCLDRHKISSSVIRMSDYCLIGSAGNVDEFVDIESVSPSAVSGKKMRGSVGCYRSRPKPCAVREQVPDMRIRGCTPVERPTPDGDHQKKRKPSHEPIVISDFDDDVQEIVPVRLAAAGDRLKSPAVKSSEKRKRQAAALKGKNQGPDTHEPRYASTDPAARVKEVTTLFDNLRRRYLQEEETQKKSSEKGASLERPEHRAYKTLKEKNYRVNDISNGLEPRKVRVLGGEDDEPPERFEYIVEIKYPEGIRLKSAKTCPCAKECWDRRNALEMFHDLWTMCMTMGMRKMILIVKNGRSMPGNTEAWPDSSITAVGGIYLRSVYSMSIMTCSFPTSCFLPWRKSHHTRSSVMIMVFAGFCDDVHIVTAPKEETSSPASALMSDCITSEGSLTQPCCFLKQVEEATLNFLNLVVSQPPSVSFSGIGGG